ncbi:hypothetical protein GCM10023065_11900 [Microbacterium laevaniformans]
MLVVEQSTHAAERFVENLDQVGESEPAGGRGDDVVGHPSTIASRERTIGAIIAVDTILTSVTAVTSYSTR